LSTCITKIKKKRRKAHYIPLADKQRKDQKDDKQMIAGATKKIPIKGDEKLW